MKHRESSAFPTLFGCSLLSLKCARLGKGTLARGCHSAPTSLDSFSVQEEGCEEPDLPGKLPLQKALSTCDRSAEVCHHLSTLAATSDSCSLACR